MYPTSSLLSDHMIKEQSQDYVHFCFKCGKGYKSSMGAQLHQQVHDGNVCECSECGKQFVSQDSGHAFIK